MAAPEPTDRIEIEGRRFAWRVVGSGPRLLLLNGYAATGAGWDPTFLAALGETFEVICPDNRGVGGSDLGVEELTVDGMAADLEQRLDARELARVPVVGWSMCGYVAQRLAAMLPGQVVVVGPDPVMAKHRAGDFTQCVRQYHERFAGRPTHRGFVSRVQIGRLRARPMAAVPDRIGHCATPTCRDP